MIGFFLIFIILIPFFANKNGNPTTAIASLVYGIISILLSFFLRSVPNTQVILCSVALGTVGIILGVKARADSANRGLGTAGMVCSIVGVVFSLLFLITVLTRIASIYYVIGS